VKRLLYRVTGRGYSAEVVFAKDDAPGAAWRVESSAPILAWMRSHTMSVIAERLTAQGATWQVLPCPDGYDAGIAVWAASIPGAQKVAARAAAIAKRRKERQ
jgi:hypothetical protein